MREGRIAAKGDGLASTLLARDDGFENTFPAISAMDVPGSKDASLQIAMLVEEKERMVTGAAEVSVPNAVFLLTMRRADARIQIEHDAIAATMFGNTVDPKTRKIGKCCEVFRLRQPARLESAHLAR